MRGCTIGRRAVGPLVLCAFLSGSPSAQPLSGQACATLLAGDAGWTSLREAALHNLAAPALRSPEALERRRASELVRDAIATGPGRVAERLCTSLTVERLRPGVLLTGYYRPVVPARRAREGDFRHPLYALPEPSLRAYSRAEIDRGALEGRTAAVAWLADPIEAFFVHVQGSAVLEFPDGRMTVGYAGSNGRAYTSIGSLLIRDGRMRRDEVTMASLKAYLRDHPSERDAILHANERYIYFQPGDDRAIGSLGVALTDGRSVAADPEVYPPGTLVFIEASAGAPGAPSRLAFVQDRGSAITGPARLDLYVGTGEVAARVAGPLQQNVVVYVLRPK